MGEGRNSERTDPAQTYATLIGGALILFGLVGFFYNSSFASDEALTADKAFGLFYVNGWQNLLHLAAGLLGLALAPLLPRLCCLASGLVWSVLAAGGFFGAHGGEAIPMMGGLLPAGTANNLLCLGLAGLAFAAAASGSRQETRSKRKAKPLRKKEKSAPPKPKVEPETSDEATHSPSIGRPRSATRSGGSRRTIN